MMEIFDKFIEFNLTIPSRCWEIGKKISRDDIFFRTQYIILLQCL